MAQFKEFYPPVDNYEYVHPTIRSRDFEEASAITGREVTYNPK